MIPLDQSYVHGVSPMPLLGLTVGQLFDKTVARWPDREALIVRHQDIRWTWRELLQEVDAVAAGLLALGLSPGERLGIWSPNNAEWVVTQFASAKAGLVLVNVNPAYRLSELEYALNKAGCKALITAAHYKSSDYVAMLHEIAPELNAARPGVLKAARLPDLRFVIRMDEERDPAMLNFSDLRKRSGEAERHRLKELGQELQFDEPINIQFTSGTTGAPKAATLTHHNIVNNAFFVGETMALSEQDRLCIPVPMYHCFSMVLGTLTCVAHGATMVFPAEGFDPLEVLRAIETEKCTALHGVPTMFIAEIDHPEFKRFDLSSLRTGIIAGAPCPIELMKRLIGEMHLGEITIAYGMTETGPVSFETSVHDPLERRVTTVGRVLPHTEVKIVDTDGRILPTGTPGELLTRGYCVMPGYWNDPQKTSAAIDQAHWIRTGDIATLDDEGYCNIVGRLKDMLIRGGENIFPREIEEFLFTNPKIEDVQVIGVPDPKFGEEVCAWIKLRPGENASEEEIREFCQGKIAHFKIPRYIKFVEEFPMTVTGKVQKYVMRQRMAEALGLTAEKTA
jgi:fatty-acyl-CoA synthase